MRKAASLESPPSGFRYLIRTPIRIRIWIQIRVPVDACQPRNFVRPNWQLLLVYFFFYIFYCCCCRVTHFGAKAEALFSFIWLLAKIQKQSANETGEQRSANCSWMQCPMLDARWCPHHFGQLLLFIVYSAAGFLPCCVVPSIQRCPDWQIIMHIICNWQGRRKRINK